MVKIDQFIKNAESISLSDSDITRLSHGDIKTITYPQLKDYQSLDDLFSSHDFVMILYETRQNYGHWIMLSKFKDSKGEYYEFFDPYGFQPDEELQFIDENVRDNLGESDYHLSSMLHGNRVVVNHTRFQQFKEDVNTCGRHCIFRFLNRRMNLKQYTEFILGSLHNNPDYLVTVGVVFCQVGI